MPDQKKGTKRDTLTVITWSHRRCESTSCLLRRATSRVARHSPPPQGPVSSSQTPAQEAGPETGTVSQGGGPAPSAGLVYEAHTGAPLPPPRRARASAATSGARLAAMLARTLARGGRRMRARAQPAAAAAAVIAAVAAASSPRLAGTAAWTPRTGRAPAGRRAAG
eukprot:scaffold526_cov356-Prasinococcus_capsulatus_cf.AAC.8